MVGDVRIIAGTTIARNGCGVLLRGASGRGKSDLALRAISEPLMLPGETSATCFKLVSDDQTVLTPVDRALIASAPGPLRDKLEVRGIGIVTTTCVIEAPLVLIADLTPGPIERMPRDSGAIEVLLGLPCEVVRIAPFEASAPIKIALALANTKQRISGQRSDN